MSKVPFLSIIPFFSFSEKKLRNLQNWYDTNGMVPYKRKSGGRIQSARTLTYEDISRVYTFIHNFAEQFAVPLPGRVPGFKRGDLKLLPCSKTKQEVYNLYKLSMEETGKQIFIFKCVFLQEHDVIHCSKS